MRIATQKEALPNDIESLIRRLGQELSCSICLSVFEDPTMTPCNHTFCRECIERAVSLTKKGSTIPCNQCPICKGKTPKRSLNPSSVAAKLCKIYEEIVLAYSEINGGNDDWIYEAGIRGNDAHYSKFGGVPLDNLSQLYPYPEKANSQGKLMKKDVVLKVEDEIDRHLLTDLEEDQTTQLNENVIESSIIYDETTQLENTTLISLPSSPLIFEETQLICCDKLIINTQELEKLTAINDSIDKELAELEMKLAATRQDNEKEIIRVPKSELSTEISNNNNNQSSAKQPKARIIQMSESKLTRSRPIKKVKIDNEKSTEMTCDDGDATFDPSSVSTSSKNNVIVSGITTTGIKDEKAQIQLAKFSEKFNIPIIKDIQSNEGTSSVSHLLIPTGPGLIVKKRTMKYFEAILLEKEIISFDWISTCLNSNKILPPTRFKVKGDEIGIKLGFTKYSEKVFSNFKFYLYGEFTQPPRDQLEKLIKSTSSTTLLDVKDLTRGTVVLADPSSQYTFEKDAQIIKKYPIVSTSWFLDSISCGRSLEFHSYLIL